MTHPHELPFFFRDLPPLSPLAAARPSATWDEVARALREVAREQRLPKRP